MGDTAVIGRDMQAHDICAGLAVLLKDSALSLLRTSSSAGLSMTQAVALSLLADAEHPLSVGELAILMRMSMPSASRAVDALARTGLATRIEAEGDRRKRQVTITDQGRSVLDELWRSQMAHVPARMAELLDADCISQLRAALAPVITNR